MAKKSKTTKPAAKPAKGKAKGNGRGFAPTTKLTLVKGAESPLREGSAMASAAAWLAKAGTTTFENFQNKWKSPTKSETASKAVHYLRERGMVKVAA